MPGPLIEELWDTLTSAVAQALGELEDGNFLIISHRHINHYVQVAGSDIGEFRIEAVSNPYIDPPSAVLTTEQYARMDKLGWGRATWDPEKTASGERPSTGSPNFFVDVPEDTSPLSVAETLVRTLREVYGIKHPSQLHYNAFHDLLGAYGYPYMPLARNPAVNW